MPQAEYTPFAYGLSDEQEARAMRLHHDAVIIDMLWQGPISTLNYPDWLAARFEGASGPAMRTVSGAIVAPVVASARGACPEFKEAWLASGVTGGNRQLVPQPAEALIYSMAFHQRHFDSQDWMIKALTAEDFRTAKAEGKAAGYLSTQEGPGPTVEFIEQLHALGMRMIQLTYNSLTPVGAGCTERIDAGISHFGQRCIEKMNELGIIVDTGHCGRNTTLDACSISSRPVVASHTAVGSLCPHDRCKSNEEFEAIAATGGVIGLMTVPFMLHESGRADMNVFLDHVDSLRDLVGVEHVGIGTDWPLSVPEALMREHFLALTEDVGFREEHGIEPLATVDGFATYLDYPNITRGLVSRGYSDEEIKSVLGGNFLRVFEAVCG